MKTWHAVEQLNRCPHSDNKFLLFLRKNQNLKCHSILSLKFIKPLFIQNEKYPADMKYIKSLAFHLP